MTHAYATARSERPVKKYVEYFVRVCLTVMACVLLEGLLLVHRTASARTWVVDRQHLSAHDDGPGTPEVPLLTIGEAASRAMPGDTVRVHAGVYRERVAPERGGESGRPIIYEAAPGEHVTIKGSEVWTPEWTPVADRAGVYAAVIDERLFGGDRDPYRTAQIASPGGQRLTLGQVFVGGVPLRQVSTPEQVDTAPGRWCVTEDGAAIRVHFPLGLTPALATTELTVRRVVFAPRRRGLNHITVRGFVIEHAANQFPLNFWVSRGAPQAGMLGCRGGYGWVIEHNTIRFARGVGIDCGAEGPADADGLGQPMSEHTGGHLIRFNTVVDNGASGIVGWHTNHTRVVGNVIERNNRLGFSAAEKAGVKLHGFVGGLIEGNLVRHNDGPGIWLDNIWRHARITRNVVVGNTGTNLFIELGEGPLTVDHNVFAYAVGSQGLAGDGVYAHDASGVLLAHNLIFFNANYGVWSHIGTDRSIATSVEGSAEEAEARLDRLGLLRARRNAVRDTLREAGHTELAGAWSQAVIDLTRGEAADASMIERIQAVAPALTQQAKDLLRDLESEGRWQTLAGASRWRIVNNMIVGNHRGTLSLPLESPRSMDNVSDYNLLLGPFDEALSETHALELGPPTLYLNTNKGRTPGSSAGSSLTLDAWRQATRWDRHSRTPVVIRPRLSATDLQLSMTLSPEAVDAWAPPLVGLGRDLMGNEYPATPVQAGPIQALVSEPRLDDRTDWVPYRGPYAKLKGKHTTQSTHWLWPVPHRAEGIEPAD